MSEKMAAIDQAVKFSKKCPECGLRNFPGEEHCSRCDAELARGAKRSAKPKEIVEFEPADSKSSKARSLIVLATTLFILLGLVLFYARQNLPGTPEALGEVAVAQPDAAIDPSEKRIEPHSLNQAPAKQLVARLKRFQGTAQLNMRFEDYDQMLNQLESDVNELLPGLVTYTPAEQSLRKEVGGAIRDYTAARNWWKTTIKNSSVLNDNDRVERLKVEWASAQTHLDNAEKLLNQ